MVDKNLNHKKTQVTLRARKEDKVNKKGQADRKQIERW